MRLVLASASPRRRELLSVAGVAFDVDPADVDETRHAGESPDALVVRLAREKALVVSARHSDRPVLGADTVVVLDDDVLGKPRDAADAVRMLERLSDRTHEVLTAVALVWQGDVTSRVERGRVRMRETSAQERVAYVAMGEPLDKAGAYAIQGGAANFATIETGARDTVVGLPVGAVLELLRAQGLIPATSGRILSGGRL